VDYEDERVSPRDKDRLLALELSRQDSSAVIRRMLAGTPASHPAGQERSAALHGRTGGTSVRYDEAFRRTEGVLVEAHGRVRREQVLAASQWLGLEGHPPARRLVMVRNDERLHHWGLFDLLLEKSREIASEDAAAAMHLAELAVAVAERLDAEVYGEERVADFKTAALAALGDARRTAGDLAGARLAFSQARIQLEMGTGDLLEEANLLGALTNLLCDLGEYGKAASSLERATALYQRVGDDRLTGASIPRPDSEEDQGLSNGEIWARTGGS
jgi:tetratricopeptide (TPR) repeat protein